MTAEQASLGSVLLAVCVCGGLLAVAAWLALGFLRRHGAILLPLYQLFFGRRADEDEIRRSAPAFIPAPKPDLRAIAQEQDFDAAVRAQEAGTLSPAVPTDPSLLRRSSTVPGRSSVTDAERTRDEEDEFGFDSTE